MARPRVQKPIDRDRIKNFRDECPEEEILPAEVLHRKVIVNPDSLPPSLLFLRRWTKEMNHRLWTSRSGKCKKKPTKVNTKKKTFSAIEAFTGNRAFIVTVLKRLQTEIFEHLGISNTPKKVDDCLDYLLQVTTGRARDQLVEIFKQGRRQFALMFAVSNQQREAFVRDKGIFFEWLLTGDKTDTPEDTLR
jgi:hypothetical protein